MKRKIELKDTSESWTDIIVDKKNVGYIIECSDGHLIITIRGLTANNIGVNTN